MTPLYYDVFLDCQDFLKRALTITELTIKAIDWKRDFKLYVQLTLILAFCNSKSSFSNEVFLIVFQKPTVAAVVVFSMADPGFSRGTNSKGEHKKLLVGQFFPIRLA